MTGDFRTSEYLRRFLHAVPFVARRFYGARYGPIGRYVADTVRIPSWLGRDEGLALARACAELPADAIIVEIGSFLGKSAILMAGACKTRGSGPDMQRYVYGKLWNSTAYSLCSQMPRFGHTGSLTEQQIKDLVAYLLDPASPVNQ